MTRILRALALATVVVIAAGAEVAASGSALGLPNPSRTPGASSARVTQKNLHSTVCVPGYTATVRPPESYTSALKRAQLASGYAVGGDKKTADYEEDHLIPLEVGGDPRSVKNLWPEPRFVTWSAARKDRLENAVHSALCAGRITLTTAQQVFSKNWIAAYPTYVH